MSTEKPTLVTAGRQAAVRRQELRRCNATVPIPAAKHKRSRSHAKQQLRQEYR